MAIRWNSAFARLPGFGVSSSSCDNRARTRAGRSSPNRATSARASAKLVASGTVGPEAITAGSSPGTSLIASVTTRAGEAAAASRPPLIAERCFRTAFISVIVAPLASSARFTACLSASVSPSAGKASSADPPPEISASTRSSGPRPRTRSSSRRAPRSLLASGTGWDASITSIRRVGTAWP